MPVTGGEQSGRFAGGAPSVWSFIRMPSQECRMDTAMDLVNGACNIPQGRALLTIYQFNTNTAKHYFCSRCGIHTHHQRRSNPRQYGVNVACLEGISPFDFQEVPVYDGSRHTSDGFPLTRAGTLVFRAAE
jgi:hypothetical protein